MKSKRKNKGKCKRLVLTTILLLTVFLVILQKGLVVNTRRWLFLLGITVCGMIYTVLPWEQLRERLKKEKGVKFKFLPDSNRLLTRIFLLLSPLISFYLVQVYGGFSDQQFLKLLFSVRGACNLLLYGTLGVFLYLICNRAKVTAFLLTVISSAFGLANYFVMDFRGSPILAADISSIGTAADVAGGYVYRLDTSSLKAVVLTVVFCCVILRQESYRWLGWKKRLAVLAGSVILYLGLSSQIFSGAFFKEHQISLNIWDPGDNYAANGSLVSMAVSYSYYHVGRPEGYSVKAVEELTSSWPLDQYENTGKQQPSVIAIMNEAFSDLSVLGHLDISGDVMPFVKNLKENTVRGKLYMSVRSSQTANSEFEFLTGCSMAFLPYRSIPYNSYIKTEIPTLTTTLKEQGYGKNMAFHPGMPDAWNRDQVYPLFGFEEFQSFPDVEAELEEEDIIHGFVSDSYGYRHLEKEFEEFRKASENPFYSFFVTIQNHSGYKKNPVDVKIALNNREEWSKETEQYLNMIRISDDALKELLEYFRKVEEPVVIVMFGDHQPGLSPKGEAKTYSSDMALYQVPYLIWANYDMEEEELDMSANYLSSYLLKIMGADMTGFHRYLLNLQERIPVITANGYIGDDGVLYDWDNPSEYTPLLEEYRMLQYNNLFDTDHRVNEFFHLVRR